MTAEARETSAPTDGGDERWRRERQSWDEQAAHRATDLAALERATKDWRLYLDRMLAGFGDLHGRRALDCGCGEGLLTRLLADRGCKVTAFDVSWGMLSKLRAEDGRPIEYASCAFEALPFADGTFEVTAGTFVLHHVDLAASARELARVMRPGARASFLETWQRNPLIRLGRRLRGKLGIPMYGTPDERPLAPSDVRLLDEAGFEVRLEFPRLVFFQILANTVFRGRPIFVRAGLRIDGFLSRFRRLRPHAYYCIVHLTRRG